MNININFSQRKPVLLMANLSETKKKNGILWSMSLVALTI